MTGTGQSPDGDVEIPVLSEDALDSVMGPEDQDAPDTMTSD